MAVRKEITVPVTQGPTYEELKSKIQELEKEARGREQADEVLRNSEERYRMIFNCSPLGMVHFDADGTVLDSNETYLGIVGAPKEKVIGFNVVESTRNELLKSAILAGLAGEPNHFEGDYQSVTGDKITSIRARYSRVTSGDGRFLGAVGIFEDIAGPNRFPLQDFGVLEENSLRAQSEEFLGKIVNSVGDPIFVKDRHHRLIFVNDAKCMLLGRKREEILGKSLCDFYPKEQNDVFLEKDEVVFETGEENVNEEEITDGEGVIRTVATKKTLYTDKHGSKFIIGVIRDMTHRKEAVEALKAAHHQLEDIIEFLPDATFVIDREKKVLAWNRAMEDMTGIEKHDVLGKDDYLYAVPFWGARTPMLVDLVMSKKPDIEKRYDFVKGSEIPSTGKRMYHGLARGGEHICGARQPRFWQEMGA